MDPKIYDGLTECNPNLAWTLIRQDVGFQLLGETMLAVPYLSEAMNYDFFRLLVKEPRGTLQKITRQKVAVQEIGPLESLLTANSNRSVLKNATYELDKGAKYNPAYEYTASDMKGKEIIKKTISLNIGGCEKYCLMNFAPKIGEVVLDLTAPALEEMKKIYLITEVCYIRNLKLTVTIGEKIETLELDKKLPIGFMIRKYPIGPDGALGVHEEITAENLRDVEWIRNEAYELPTAPANVEVDKNLKAATRNPKDELPPVPACACGTDRGPLPPIPRD